MFVKHNKKTSGSLFVIATPIGNLADITLRALETLKSVDFIVCEDTRVTIKLLNHYNIKKPLIACHQHSHSNEINAIVKKIQDGFNIGLVTDAGTPGIADPGNQLVATAVRSCVKVVPIPGSSALSAIISVAGINMQKFIFLGFPPQKKGRLTFFRTVAEADYPVIYYESPYRITKNLELLAGLSSQKHIILGRELTKFFEEIIRGPLESITKLFKEKKVQIKGEIVLIVH